MGSCRQHAVLPHARAARPRPLLRGTPVTCAAAGGDTAAKRVVIVGGSGRVGGSTAAALAACGAPLTLTLAGRDAARATRVTAGAPQPALRDASFVRCDVDDPASLAAALAGADLVVHAAGPFQRQPRCAVLEAAIAARVPYLDVCDDTAYGQQAKAQHAAAQAAGIRAVVCGGMFPGVSNLMAAQLVRAEEAPPKRITFSYFTAGSGGAGTTILATSILLCGEEVVAYKDGEAVRVPPVSGRRVVDFGPVR
jgi:saccharopine dehydrogenase-like NADP-dependent oxidoreductase